MKSSHFAAILLALVAIAFIAGLSPLIGWPEAIAPAWTSLGTNADIVVNVLALILLLCVFQLLRNGPASSRGSRQTIGSDIEAALGKLIAQPAAPSDKGVWLRSAVVIAAFGVMFAIFLSKFAGGFLAKWPFDQVWHQAFIDYDALWRTPFVSIPGNVLYQFDIRLPVNSSAMPVLGLSELFPRALRVPASYSLLFAGMLLLYWAIGATFGLRPVPRAIFAGLVALMTVIPSGLEWIVWLLPQNFFTTQLVLATWWGEAPLLALATIVCFYWVGQCGSVVRNGLVSFAFALGCFLAVVAYPAGGVYFVPLMAVYCAVFLFTSAGRPEWAWKLIICAVVAAAALLLKVPQFFAYLYGYTFGSHFIDFMQAPPSALINDTFMVSVRGFEWRRVLIFFVAIATAVVMAARGPRPLRRFSLALLACEIAIVAGSLVNALFFRAPILFAYAEVAHSSLWAAYVVLFGMAIVVVLDQRLALLPAGGLVHELIARRRPAALAAVAVMVGAYALWAPRPSIIAYPPAKTPPVELLARELALAPGAPFRGRALTIFAPEGEDFYAIALRYRQALGSDFYEELLPFGIPTANESQHWTSPVTFAFLRRFFGHEGSEFDKNFFWLDRYNAKIARLIGVRMVVSDADVNEGAVVYEQRVGGRRLRIYRLDNTNLGQYSPTHLSRANSAAAAIAAMEADSFDPRQDAVVEDDMPGDLVAAGAVSVIVEAGPRLRVRARSPGRSLIVLPFEFSHCLHLHGPTSARILPVNLQQVALLFEKEADVSIDFQYGVFDSACRGADIARAKALDLGAIIWPPHI